MGIAYAIRTKLLSSVDLNNSFTSLLNGPYSENNLNKFLDTLMNALTDGKSERNY